MSKEGQDKIVATKLYSVLTRVGAAIKGYADLYDAFNVLSLRVATQQAAMVREIGELLHLMPESVKKELRDLATTVEIEEASKYKLGGKSLETLMRELLGDNQNGSDQ